MEDEELNFGSGNLYSAFPIPAYQVLGKAKEYNAQRVLLALVSHMGYNNRSVWPSYNRIMSVSGVRNRNSVSRSISTLVDFGFVTTFYWREGKKEWAKYYLQDCCWNPSKMNEKARVFRIATDKCLACLLYLEKSEYFVSGEVRVHYRCGGFVIPIVSTPKPAVQEPWRDRLARQEDSAVE